jgi:nucleotide-binding universal stress UspA family protein
MFKRVIVPVDGSDFSWRALGVAAALARQTDAELEVLQVVMLPDDAAPAEQIVREQLAETGVDPEMLAKIKVMIEVMGDNVASTIAGHAVDSDGSIVVMSSVGRGRTAALIGSIA